MNKKTSLWSRPFVTIMIVNFMLFLAINMLGPTLPVYLQQSGFSNTITGLTMTMFTIGSLFVRPIAGGVLDQYGRRIIFYVSASILTILVFSYSLTTAIFAIFMLRLLHGLIWGFTSTATSTMATDVIPRHMMGRGIGIFGLSMSIGVAFAPSIAFSVLNNYGFRGVVTFCSVCFIGALLLSFLYPFAPVEKKEHKKLTKEDMFERTALLPAIIIGLVTLTIPAITVYVPLFALDLGIKNAGIFFTLYAFGLLGARGFIGRVIDNYGIAAATIPSLFFLFISLVCLGFAHNLIILAIGGLIYGLGYGGAQTAMQSMSVMKVPREHFGAANGTYFIGFDSGIGLGALIAGVLSDYFGYSTMFLLLTISIAIAMVLVLKYRPKTKN